MHTRHKMCTYECSEYIITHHYTHRISYLWVYMIEHPCGFATYRIL